MKIDVKAEDVKKTVSQAVKDLKRGRFVVVVDEYDRENEGDLVLAAEKATPAKLNFMLKEARGLMCLPCEGKILDRLHVPMMTKKSNNKFQTPFTVSVDASKNISTGVSVQDRMKVLKVLLNDSSVPQDLVRPGHLFPLRAHPQLLKGRRGHTEATIELLRLAKTKPIGVVVEIMNDDGSMARASALKKIAMKHKIKIISIPEIISYQMNNN